jgi:hypothetical protein
MAHQLQNRFCGRRGEMAVSGSGERQQADGDSFATFVI